MRWITISASAALLSFVVACSGSAADLGGGGSALGGGGSSDSGGGSANPTVGPGGNGPTNAGPSTSTGASTGTGDGGSGAGDVTVGTGGDTGSGGDGTGANSSTTQGSGGATACPDEAPVDCRDGSFCIPESYLCDGEDDCDDASDEEDCPEVCGDEEFTCEGDGACILADYVCDGEADCEGGEDEVPALCGESCNENEAQCADGQCIPLDYVCDGEDDCAGSEDEDSDLCSGDICDSGITNSDPALTFCLAVNCCAEFNDCSLDGDDVDGCIECLQDGGGPYCDAALSCAVAYCEG